MDTNNNVSDTYNIIHKDIIYELNTPIESSMLDISMSLQNNIVGLNDNDYEFQVL